MESFLAVFKALSDRNRLRIVKMLETRPLCVCEITAILGLAVSTTSKHLRILKNANLIFEQKEGKWVNYHLNKATRLEPVKEMLPLVKTWLNDDRIIRQDRIDAGRTDRVDICRH